MTMEKHNSLQFLFLDRARFEEFGDWVDGVFISRVPWELRDRLVRWAFIDPQQRLQYFFHDIHTRRLVVTREGWEIFVGWMRDALDERLEIDTAVIPRGFLDE